MVASMIVFVIRYTTAVEYCDERVCLSVCTHISETTLRESEFHRIFCACYPWLFLSTWCIVDCKSNDNLYSPAAGSNN